VRKKKEGSSVELSLEEQKSGSALELDREKKGGSSVQRSGSSMEINLDEDEKEDDGSPSSSLLLGGPGSDAGSSESYSNELNVGASTEERGSEASMVDLGSSVEINLDEEREKAVESDSSVVATREDSAVAIAEPPPSRRKRGGGMGLLIACGAGLLVASLLWIFGPLDGLRGSLRDTVGLSTEKKTQASVAALSQPAISPQRGQAPAAKQQDDDDAPSGKEEPKVRPAPEETKENKSAPPEESKTIKPAAAPVKQPAEKPETPPAPTTVAENPAANKNVEAIGMIAEAAKLAQEQKYQDATAMLQKARAAGDKSDEGLRRFFDELQASWQVREKLGTAGYLKSQKDPAQALEALLKEKSDISATIAAAQEKIKAKGGNLAQAIESLMESAKKSDEQAKTSQAAMKKLEKEKADSQSALQNASTLLKEGKYLDDQSPNLAQGVEKLLADKKNSDTQIKEATAKLKDAEETIQDMTKKLVAPRDTPQAPAPTISTSAKISPPDITVAEKYYSAGLTHFWNGDYASAEKDFATAVRFYPDDARSFYYLGLSYWQEGKRTEASEAFQKGNALELRSRPSSPVINATFERIQGAARKALDQERELPQVQ
jgi:TolA-binding protein